ncbi:MAG TPA: VOC family protein [Streptosporangiaceae bacterium]|nr:VOC family protein [Streptosporangiaceae bacterium]
MDAAIKDVGAIILFVADLQRSRVFYHEVLGLDVEFEDSESVGFKVEGLAFIVLQVDRARVQLQGEPTATPGAGATAFLTTFTGDVDGLHADLAGRGVHFFQRPADQPWGVRTAYFKDPDGHVWEIAQPIERPDS